MSGSLPRTIGLLASILLLVAQASEASPRPGDLLVSDEHNGRVLRVVPKTGHVETLSPRPGQENFLQRPTGIAVSRTDRSIYVLDDADGQLIRIDPVTGEQSVQRTLRLIDPILGLVVPWPLSFPGTLRGLEMPPREPGAAGDRLLVIGSAGVHETSFNGSTWSPPVLRTAVGFPSPAGAALDRYGDPLRLWVATGGTTLQEATASGAGLALEQAALFPGQQIVDVDVSPSGRSAMVVRTMSAPKVCISAVAFSLSFQALSSGQQLRCPTALALGLRGELYIADVLTLDGGLAKIVKVVDGAETVVAALPPGDSVFTMPADIEVMPGEATFEWMTSQPGSVYVFGVSARGEVAVGADVEDGSWSRWTASEGLQNVDTGVALGVSLDGSIVWGYVPAPADEEAEQFTWRAASGSSPVLPPQGFDFFGVGAMSGDGSTLLGTAWVANRARAIRWQAGSPVVLPNLQDTLDCLGTALSRNGSVAAGVCKSPAGSQLTRWDASGSASSLHGVPLELFGATDVSHDGSIVAGIASLGGRNVAFRWAAAGGIQPLQPSEADYPTQVVSLSGDGHKVLIATNELGFAFNGRSLWDPDFGYRDLWTELVEVHGMDLEPAVVNQAALMSKDARTLVGYQGTLPNREIWRIRLVPEPGGGALAIAALVPLAWLGLRRVQRGDLRRTANGKKRRRPQLIGSCQYTSLEAVPLNVPRRPL